LRAALALGEGAQTVVLTKETVNDSATAYAQGGIAVAMGEDDTFALHEQDTLVAGDGLCDAGAVKLLVEEGPAAIEQLLSWGAKFDRSGAQLERTREAAHSRSRVLHAHGDSTGREIAVTLAERAACMRRLEFVAHGRAQRLLRDQERVVGIEFTESGGTGTGRIYARAVLLATGGLGQLYGETTNPAVATGDGPALAYEAGAVLADMEFVQFHPTALALPNAPRFLLSEALRGEGAILRNPTGDRFMNRYHADAELAPRDVVARALDAELRIADGSPDRGPAACYLDATALPAEQLQRRFPRIAATLAHYGLHLAKDWIPVRPAAHYAMGGIATDWEGRSSLPGLFAAGETACTGVHGANRLASNSLLEGLVFGARAGTAMGAMAATEAATAAAGFDRVAPEALPPPPGPELAQVRAVLSGCAGVVRRGEDLERGLRALELLAERGGLAAVTAAAIVRAAWTRQESRGAHFRSDFAGHAASLAGRHSLQQRGAGVEFGSLLEPAAGIGIAMGKLQTVDAPDRQSHRQQN
ncbi:MAG: L-aspartate oxidase, partial [Terriglobales bacterium]